MKVITGVIKKVITDEQYELIKQDLLNGNEIKLNETVRRIETDREESYEYLPIRISYQDVDINGNEKYVYNEEKEEYIKSYVSSPILCATAKEMRILLELEEYSPVKIVYQEVLKNERKYFNIVCVQNQLSGKL